MHQSIETPAPRPLGHRPLSLGGHVESRENKKALFLQGRPCTEFAYGRSLPCKNKAFHSPKIQHSRRVIRVCWPGVETPLMSTPPGLSILLKAPRSWASVTSFRTKYNKNQFRFVGKNRHWNGRNVSGCIRFFIKIIKLSANCRF